MSVESDIAELKAALAGLPARLASESGVPTERPRGELTSDFQKGDWDNITSATMMIYVPASATPGDIWVSTGEEVPVYDNGYLPDGGLESGTKIEWKRINGQRYYDGGC